LADYLLIKELSLSIRKFIRILITPLAGTVIMSGALIAFRHTIDIDQKGRILMLVLVGIVLYSLTIGIIDRIIVCDSKKLKAIKAWPDKYGAH
jgi:hypothetical protein